MNPVRDTFLETADMASAPLGHTEARRWEEPSALRQLSVRGLAGHLFRGAGAVEAYLDRPEPDVEDLCVSVGIATPELPAEASGEAIRTLVEVARLGHGDAAVLRLTRRERDAVEALRVM
jgi:hypothetical protein